MMQALTYIVLILLAYQYPPAQASNQVCPIARPQALHGAELFKKQTEYTCHGQSDTYIIRPAPEKGLGVFAGRDLELGTVIMREAPVLKIRPPEYVKGTGYPMAAISQLLRADFEHISAEEQNTVMSLAYHGTAAEGSSSDPLGMIFKTNAYKSGDEIGLFPKIARINHSCRPNTSYVWHAKSDTRIMYANRKIRKGEEILDSYISLLFPQQERQKLLNPYGFTCSCEACAAKHKMRKESDSRRVEIKKGFSDLGPYLKLEDNIDEEQAARNADLSARLVDLVHEEGLADYYATAYRAAAFSHARAGDWRAATIWANKGYEWRVMENAEGSHAAEMHQLTATFIDKWKDDLRKQNMLTQKP